MSPHIDRREFLRASALGAGAACAACSLGLAVPRLALAQDVAPRRLDGEASLNPTEARHYKKLDEKKVECEICPRKCRVADLERGSCGVRENRGGRYYLLVHSRVVALHTDPIEKKPLFHYRPGTPALSLATAGCNIECKFCQNWQIAQFRPEQLRSVALPPEDVVRLAQRDSTPTIAYTYTEPVVYYEYMYDTAAAARKAGIGSVMISNGFINPEPLGALLPHLDAVKIDFKSFRDEFYRDTCRGERKPVLDTLVALKKSGKWFELVMLVVPTLNDSEAELRDLSRWVVENLGKDVPIHFTRFHPDYRLRNLPRTPVPTLEKAHQIARAEGVRFPYVGNVPGHPAESTSCPGCGEVLIRRVGYRIVANTLKHGRCPGCDAVIPGVWS